jgi:hypothetical protein
MQERALPELFENLATVETLDVIRPEDSAEVWEAREKAKVCDCVLLLLCVIILVTLLL